MDVYADAVATQQASARSCGRGGTLTHASGRGLDGAPPPGLLADHRGGGGPGQPEPGVALVLGPGSQGKVLAQDAAVDRWHGHSAGQHWGRARRERG